MAKVRKRFSKGVELSPENLTAEDLAREGELAYDSDSDKLKYRNASATKEVVNTDEAQTLENKTIDATSATGNNTLSADSNDIVYDNATSGLTATNVKAALDEVQANIEGQDEASEISYDNATSGLAATNVQAALDEIDGDLDTHIASTSAHGTAGDVVGTSDAQTLTNKTIDANSNTISNLAHGTEVDNPSSGVHGVTGDVVGTSDAQTLTNKTLGSGTVISNPVDQGVSNDAATGEATISVSKGVMRLTSGSLTGITGFAGDTSENERAIIVNKTGGPVQLRNNSGSAPANSRLLTGIGQDLELANDASIVIQYNTVDSLWNVVGGAGIVEAVDVEYDNSTSGLAATDVQSALDEIDGDLDTHIAATSAHGTTGNVVGTSDTQTLTNKTFDDEITFQEITTPSTPASGYRKFYPKADGKLYHINDDGIESEVGAGSSQINYIDNSNFDVDISGYSTYADAASDVAADGTGGTPNVTIARNTSLPLRSPADLRFTKDAANRQGEGFSYDFSIDNADRAQMLTISFDKSPSGNYNDDDMKVFVYDTTNSRLIRVSGENIKAGEGKHYARFQTSPDSNFYRLIFHVASTSASAYQVEFDKVQVGPQAIAYGTPVTDWKEFTPTGTWTTNTTYSGKYRRVGDQVEVQVAISLSGAPNVAALAVNLPPGLSVDESKVDILNTVAAMGSGTIVDSSASQSYVFTPSIQSGQDRFLLRESTSGTLSGNVDANAPISFASGDSLTFFAKAPIQGWSSNAKMSEDLGNREVVVKANGNGGTSPGTSVDIDWNDEIIDTTASWNGTQFSAPETGYYIYEGAVRLSTSTTDLHITEYVNGSNNGKNPFYSSDTVLVPNFSGVVYLTKGDLLSFRPDKTVTLADSPSDHHIHIQKLASPQTMLETETVAARYTSDSGQALNNTASTLVFEDLKHDTHSAYNTSTGEYTVPVSGKYQVNAGFLTQSTSWTFANNVQITIQVNGSDEQSGITVASSSGTYGLAANVPVTLDLEEGDIVEVDGFSSVSTTLNTGSRFNYFSIARIK